LTGWTFGTAGQVSSTSPTYTGLAGGYTGFLNGSSFQTYCVEPHCNWQRDSNQTFNGLLREDISNKRHQGDVTEEAWTRIENSWNHRPRKLIGFKTPYEGFHASLNRVALRP
jgi:IS30 family transposase